MWGLQMGWQSRECWHVRCNVTWLHDCCSKLESKTYANDGCGLTEEIEREIGIKIESEPKGDGEKRKFMDKTQDELIELLVRAQVRVLLSSLPRAGSTSVQGIADDGLECAWWQDPVPTTSSSWRGRCQARQIVQSCSRACTYCLQVPQVRTAEGSQSWLGYLCQR